MAGQFNLFLSNVWEEFPWHRDLKQEIREEFGDFWKVLGVDQSSSAPLVTFLESMVSVTDLFIGIVGHRYGTRAPNFSHSYTELEYRTFAEFLQPPGVKEYHGFFPGKKYQGVKAASIHHEPFCSRWRQKQFREHVHAKHTLKIFHTRKQLYSSVKNVLVGYIKRYSSSTRNWWHCNCEHRIDRNFQGRLQERIYLSRWLENDTCQVLASLGEASIGKSALAWVWMQRDVRDELIPCLPPDLEDIRERCRVQMPVEGVFWWSFSPNYSFEEFINRLFVFARIFLPEKDLPDNLDGARHKEKLTYIFMLLRQRRLLLVLDGFESQLTYKAMASEEMQTESGRSCESRLASDFLIEATTKIMRSRVLLTTQCLPMELDDDKLCRKLWLRPLIKEIASRVSSVALADYSFPDENRQQIHALVEAVSWLDYRGNLNPVYPFEELTESHTIDPQRVQWVIKVYKRAKEISAGQIFLVGTAEVVKSMELDRKRPGLFQWLRSMQLIPALKSLIADLIARLLDLASAIKDKSLSRVSRILYSPFLADFSRPPEKQQQPGFSFGGKQAEIELLSALLAKGPSPSLSSGAVNLFATILSRLGGNQALTPPVVSAMRHQAVDPVYEGLGEEKGFAAITIQQLKMGRFGSARQSLSREIELCREIGDTDRERAGNLMLRVMKDGGDFLDRMNFRIHTFSNERSSFLRNVYDAMYAKKIGEKRSALKFARTALYHLQTTEDARDKICANWLVGESFLEALSIDNSEPARNYILKEARRHLDQAQTDAQQNQLTDYEADTLLSLARWHRANAQLQEARDCCDEALHIAEDYGYRLKQADICNCIGYLELDSGRPKQAMKWAERAKKLAFWNHPTDQYMPAITEAEKLLKECRI